VLRAFAQALVPPGDGLPAAEVDGGVGVVEPVARLLAGVTPRTRAGIRLALRVFDRTAWPRPFHRLPAAARVAHIERMECSRSSLRRDLVLLVKTLAALGYARDPAVQAAAGVSQRCSVADGASPPRGPRLDPGALRAPPGEMETADVVVVGSGAGGAAAARVLAERGLSVVVVEEGSYYDASSYSSDPFEALALLYRDGGLTACEGRPIIPLPLGRCVGGTTVVNSGTCFRTPGDVLVRWRDEHGIAWATELDAEFESVERDLRVTPVDPVRAGRNAELCRAGAEALGASNGPIARNAGAVVCCGTCPTGCALDAKQATHVSELPRAVAAGARVRAGARVERVLISGGRAAGVACRGGYGVHARAVVVAGGAVGTPELLLRGRLAGASGELGRNLRIHPACWVGARFDEEVRGWDGVMQSWYVDEWHDRGLFLEATFTPLAFGAHWLRGAGEAYRSRLLDYGRMGIIGVHLSDTSTGRVTLRGGRARITYRLLAPDVRTILFGLARAADIHFAAGAREVFPQVGRIPALRAGEGTAALEEGRVRPGELRLEAFHPMGTARMGADPRRSVVSPSGEAHDVPGLYVADASLFPTSLGVNPMITIMACARRIAAGLAERLG
jgi:choline dehydrogenase-like flavoprotein